MALRLCVLEDKRKYEIMLYGYKWHRNGDIFEAMGMPFHGVGQKGYGLGHQKQHLGGQALSFAQLRSALLCFFCFALDCVFTI